MADERNTIFYFTCSITWPSSNLRSTYLQHFQPRWMSIRVDSMYLFFCLYTARKVDYCRYNLKEDHEKCPHHQRRHIITRKIEIKITFISPPEKKENRRKKRETKLEIKLKLYLNFQFKKQLALYSTS